LGPMPSPDQVPGRSTRRRGLDLERAIFSATREELAHGGYAGLTFDGIASRAHTSRAVLYRRWQTRAELVIAALVDTLPGDSEVPDTGTLRGDVLGVLSWAKRRFDRIGRDVVLGLTAETARDGELAAFVQAELVGSMRQSVMAPALARAAARGEVDLDRLTSRVIAVPLDLVRHDLLTFGSISPSALAEIVDDVFLPLVGAPTGAVSPGSSTER